MKRILLSLTVLAALVGTAFADPNDESLCPSHPVVTVESLDDSVATTLTVAFEYASNASSLVTERTAPKATKGLYTLQSALTFLTMQGVDVTELGAREAAEESYITARGLFYTGTVFLELGDVYAAEAKDVTGVEAYILTLKAATSYYTGAFYLEQSYDSLKTVIDTCAEGEALIEALTPDTPAVDEVTGRYHLRSRVNRFFSRSRRWAA